LQTHKITVVKWLIWIAIIGMPRLLDGEMLTLQQAIENAEANNRAIRSAELERAKALARIIHVFDVCCRHEKPPVLQTCFRHYV